MQKIIPVLFAYFLTSCHQPPVVVGGACSYKKVEGIAIITDTQKPADPTLCKQQESKTIKFQFITNNKKNTVHNQLLEIANTHAFPVKWVNKKGFTVGSKHPMTKMIIQSGTCTPVIYSLSNIDNSNEVTIINKMCNNPDWGKRPLLFKQRHKALKLNDKAETSSLDYKLETIFIIYHW